MASPRQIYKQHLNGKRVLPPDALLFLLDESLGSPVAKALALVQYPFVTVEAVMGQQGIPDPEIIRWCATHNAIWVHADDQARKQHKVSLRDSGISTLLLHRKKRRHDKQRAVAHSILRIASFDSSQATKTFRSSLQGIGPNRVGQARLEADHNMK